MSVSRTVAVDFDHTIKNDDGGMVIPGAKEALETLRSAGYSILIHSCNNPEWIRLFLSNHDIPYDDIWEGKGKPVCCAYIDDCGVGFTGDWGKALEELEALPARRERIKKLTNVATTEKDLPL